jgi:hypothetical protein
MNTRIVLFLIIFATGFIFTSCDKDKMSPKPEITSFELGYDNSKTGFVGSDFHIEAEIVAEGKIDKITVEIHPEGEHGKSAKILLHNGEWEVDTTYTKFSGLKNTKFHEHLEIPIDAEPGHYHLHFIVTDMEGQQTSVEEEIEIKTSVAADIPFITIGKLRLSSMMEHIGGKYIWLTNQLNKEAA